MSKAGGINDIIYATLFSWSAAAQTFTDIGASLVGVQNGSVAWGDYDNDGDLDILLTGDSSSGPVSKIYRNDGTANLAAVRAKPNRYRPFRIDPAQGIPKHAYSPFDKINQPSERPLLAGRDFTWNRLVIKFTPQVKKNVEGLSGGFDRQPGAESEARRTRPGGVGVGRYKATLEAKGNVPSILGQLSEVS